MIVQAPEILFDDQTWLIADTHFFHENIGLYCTRPDGWQDLIIQNWNSFIKPSDIVFHIGDLALGKKENIENLVPLLNGKLYLMRGNHDRRGAAFYRSLGITLVKDPYYLDHSSGLRLVFSHRPIVPLSPGVFNLHGHIHNNPAPGLGPCHVNLSIEVREYSPWRLGDILQPYLDSRH
ncbi:MAG: metallophosphoesterase [Anaerolineales bacterium]|jgi:calcineurin-like phosphoesterase family protein